MVVALPFLNTSAKMAVVLPLHWEVCFVRAPRKDLVRNRQRVVTAAREAFIERGPEVSLEEIARRAGWARPRSTATFPTRTT
ncbi:TetR family transcriptional regulator [Mycobacterium sp.]|jgi:hypothetical protein|uniref:TetR family transcriptional regulator n=1 Tax=Mycobacterium sp. TaxID=1785 RepID=UPI00333F53B1|nr:TetR family transcriptional regulator [Mycobacterium sp.]